MYRNRDRSKYPEHFAQDPRQQVIQALLTFASTAEVQIIYNSFFKLTDLLSARWQKNEHVAANPTCQHVAYKSIQVKLIRTSADNRQPVNGNTIIPVDAVECPFVFDSWEAIGETQNKFHSFPNSNKL